MKTELFICSFHKDFPYLSYCLRSIEKFARGFSGVTIVVPDYDLSTLNKMVCELSGESGIPFYCKSGPEWENKGFLWHEAQIVRADEWCPAADFICHFDSDCIFTEPVTPERFFCSGKPILRYEAYATIGARVPGVLKWKEATEACVPFKSLYETMRCHTMTHIRDTYAKTRQLIEQTTGKNWYEYILSCRNEYPQTFAEFPTLGAVAMECFPNRYFLYDCGKQSNPDRQDIPVIQFWSHGKTDEPQHIWVFGKQTHVIPEQVVREYL